MIRGITILLLITLSFLPISHAGEVWNNQANHFDKTGEIPMGPSGGPASATTSCYKGLMRHDSVYLYVCVATNTWKRTELVTWSLTDVLLMSDGVSKILLDDGVSFILIRQ